MCNRAARLLMVAVVVLPIPLPGQELSPLRSHADSLLREWREASLFADVQDSLQAAARFSGRDTIRVEQFTIIANPSPLPVRQAATEAWPVIARFYGSATAYLPLHPVLIQAVDPDTAAPPARPIGGSEILWNTDHRQLARLLIGLADLSGLDRDLQDWLGGPLVPAPDSLARRGGVYVELVTAPSLAVRRCFGGDRQGCQDALSATDSAGRLTRWYGPEERRYLVLTQYRDFLNKGAQAAEFHSCAAGDDAACLGLLESLPPGSLPRPLNYGARYSYLETAVALGGPETISRLLATPPGVMGARLAVAARVSEDSLTARWRADILAARPKPVSLPRMGVWVALAWTAVFMTCGLRSSRWRVS